MGGRGTSSRARTARAKTSNGGLRYKGKVETTQYSGWAHRYISEYEKEKGLRDDVSYKIGRAYYDLDSTVRKLNRSNAKLHGIKPTRDPEFSRYAFSMNEDQVKNYAERTGESFENLREIRNRKVRLANKKEMTMSQFKEIQLKKLERSYRNTVSLFGADYPDAKEIAAQIKTAKNSPTGDSFPSNEKINLARFEKNGGRYRRWE